MSDEEQKVEQVVAVEIEPVPVASPEEIKRRTMQADFAMGANTRHLRLPNGLEKGKR